MVQYFLQALLLSLKLFNENFITWPGIESLNFNTLLGTSKASELGHLDQERSNLQLTKT